MAAYHDLLRKYCRQSMDRVVNNGYLRQWARLVVLFYFLGQELSFSGNVVRVSQSNLCHDWPGKKSSTQQARNSTTMYEAMFEQANVRTQSKKAYNSSTLCAIQGSFPIKRQETGQKSFCFFQNSFSSATLVFAASGL